MIKFLVATLAVVGAVWFSAQVPANAASPRGGIANVVQIDLSAHRRNYRHTHRRAAPRYYRYPGPQPYGYYGPTYYERPYSRPAPMFFGLGGRW
jgi:hypothetical protein